MSPAYAHSKNLDGYRHLLVDHANTVAAMAKEFASIFGAGHLGQYLGLWHDTGKFHPDFQSYLLSAEANPNRKQVGPDHKAAGARLALDHGVDPLRLLIQGHHGGLKNRAELQQWYHKKLPATEVAMKLARETISRLDPSSPLEFPSYVTDELTSEFFLRMLFSTLVDADFLDTERHFSPDKTSLRGGHCSIDDLWQRQLEDQLRFRQAPRTLVNQIRAEIYASCVAAAVAPTGFFRLTVPTGGGKTRSGMAFALKHALENKLQRIIIAVPFLTITQQTTSVYRSMFDRPGDERSPLIEDHSATTNVVEADEYEPRHNWQRLAAENWDAPIIVTTTVQLFESVFANGTSRCRKLHRLANSVIILDEAQTLPVSLLEPILDGLTQLTTHYGSSVVLSTATQPAYEAIPIFSRTSATEIVPEPERHFAQLKRVDYDWQVSDRQSWTEIATQLRAEPQALCIVNTKRCAMELLDELGDPNALHLSTLLCGEHRIQVIDEVKRRLENNEPCRLIATQVVEAGVDLDFPIVFRALAPLDSIIQAAGRANREGRRLGGRIVIFRPVEERMPPGSYTRAAQIALKFHNTGKTELNDPAIVRSYFRELYTLEGTDTKKIQTERKRLDYPEVAKKFRLIDQDTLTVVVPFGALAKKNEFERMWERIERRLESPRLLMRKIRPYTVSMYSAEAKRHEASGWLRRSIVLPDIAFWQGDYDLVRGITASDPQPDQFIV